MINLILTSAAAAALMAAGCHEKPEGGDGSVSLHSEAEMTLPAAETDSVISFTATADCTAETDGNGRAVMTTEQYKGGDTRIHDTALQFLGIS